MNLSELKDTLSEESPIREQPWEALGTMATQVAIASDAQFAIWRLKVVRMVMTAALVVPLSVALLGLSVYGFVLLDRTFGIALEQAQLAPWASPLIRGLSYLLLTLTVVWTGWNKLIAQIGGQD